MAALLFIAVGGLAGSLLPALRLPRHVPPAVPPERMVAPGRARRVLTVALTDTTGFERKSRPRPGEWETRFAEPHQSLDEYVADGPVRAAAPTPPSASSA